jgi:poly(A) polymerase Pap1
MHLAQKSNFFHIVRNVEEARVPIIELQLLNKQIASVDLQINELVDGRLPTRINAFFSFMTELDLDHMQLYRLSGIFENFNLRKYIANYKDYQVVITFVKFWARKRHVYGKGFGYLSGCSWSIMVIYYLANLADFHVLELNNSAARFERIIKGFFRFYSEYDWNQAVSQVNLNHVAETSGKYQEKRPLMILQSVYPYYNTASAVQEPFKKVIVREIQRAALIQDYEKICEHLEVTSQRALRFLIKFKDGNLVSHVLTLIKGNIHSLIYRLQKAYRCEIRPFCDFDSCSESLEATYSIGFGESNERLVKGRVESYCNEFMGEIRRRSHGSQFEIDFETVNFE